jgi:hypothetical protein
MHNKASLMLSRFRISFPPDPKFSISKIESKAGMVENIQKVHVTQYLISGLAESIVSKCEPI